jgi:hypothetical protein
MGWHSGYSVGHRKRAVSLAPIPYPVNAPGGMRGYAGYAGYASTDAKKGPPPWLAGGVTPVKGTRAACATHSSKRNARSFQAHPVHFGFASEGSVVTPMAGFARARRPHPGRHTTTPADFRYALAVSLRTPVTCSMRRKGHPSFPSAMTCCFFSSLKTQYKKGAPFGVRFGCLPQTIQKGTPFYD